MKILLTSNTTWNLAHFRAPLISALATGENEVVALAPSDEMIAKLEARGVRHIPLCMDNKGVGPMKDIALVRTFKRIFKDERPDVVLSFTIKNNIYGAMAARSLSIGFLPNVSGLGTAFLGAWWLETVAVQLYRIAFRPLPFVIFQNPDDAGAFLDRKIVRNDQVVIVPGSGIDLGHFRPTPLPAKDDAHVTFLLIARMLRDKGIREFVDAARILKSRFPGARFCLLGSTEAENRTAIERSAISDWQAEGMIEYLGETDDVRDYIRQADCVVLPSYREGMPRTLLEAAAMSRPLVATDVPGCRDVVRDELNGYLCRARDPNDLANALERMITVGKQRRIEMGNNGRELVEKKFDQGKVVDIYRKTIAKLMTNSSFERKEVVGK